MCSSSSGNVLISPAVMQSSMTVGLMVMHIPRISLSLSHGCFWIATYDE